MLITRQLVCQCRNSLKLLQPTSSIHSYHTIRLIGFEDDLKGKFLKYAIPQPSKLQFQQNVRHKYSDSKKKSSRRSNDEDSDDEIDENTVEDIDKNTKIIKCSVNSLRADLLVKSGLGLARNKVETLFYESKIRINGKKLLKKSVSLNVGDEIDVFKGKSTLNPDDINVARIEILSAVPKNESIYVTLKRFKLLQIQNYEKDPVSV